MKKLTAILAAASILTAVPMDSAAYDYEHYYSDYIDEYNYSTEAEYKIGTFSQPGSRFDGCDLYTRETVEAYEWTETLEVKYDYLIVPDDIIGTWFDYKKKGDKRFEHKYDIKMPLHTGYNYNYKTGKLEDSHCYDLYFMQKKVPYICIKTDSQSVEAYDTEKAAELLPKTEKIYVGKDVDGRFVYYISTGKASTRFNETEDEVDEILTESDAKALLSVGNEHLLSVEYFSNYEIQYIPFFEYPVYSDSIVEKAEAIFEEHGISYTLEDITGIGISIVPDNPIPAVDYFELMTEIKEREGIMPYIPFYEDSSSIQTVSHVISKTVEGDANNDGILSIADAVVLKNYLLGNSSLKVDVDMNNDGITDVYDLILMRKRLIEKLS